MSIARTLRIAAESVMYPALAASYRAARRGPVSPALLKALGIADISYRSDFYTLSRAADGFAAESPLIAECGVYRGSTLLGVANTLRAAGATDWQLVGFDSFEGFPEPAPEDALADGSFHPRALKGAFADASYESLRARIRALGFEKRVTLVKGYFEETLPQWSDRTFAIVHIDCDLYQSYLTCLEFFYDRMIPGGYMIFDEYDFSAPVYPGAERAIDGFFAGKPESVERFAEATNPRYFVRKGRTP